jgi:hypothetical protein
VATGVFGHLEAKGKLLSENVFLEIANFPVDTKPLERMLNDESFLSFELGVLDHMGQ